MSSQQYYAERDKIDFYIQSGYRISGVTENLSGAFVTFTRPPSENQHHLKKEILHIQHADSRKYFSHLLLNQLNEL
ncbi:hypothetical protein [Bacillus kexueae]|uniref:hypothetical protein n=1 Tax=Aeribacillus kexueae TaxID=2078952 RepID=UPI001FAFFC63|nr:hypothetical protein [Bacillus kexueae]